MKKDPVPDSPPQYSDILGQPGQGRTRPVSPSPSYHTIDIRDDDRSPPQRIGDEAGPTASHPGRLHRVWQTWKDTRSFNINVGKNGYTVLHHAAQRTHCGNLQHLLNKSALRVDVQTTSGWTPLHFAILADKSAEVHRTQAFLKAGASPSLKGEKGWNALHLASAHGRAAVVAVLLDHPIEINARAGADHESTNKEDPDGNLTTLTAVELAARHGHSQVVTMLLEAGASPGSVDRTTALHEAASWGQSAVVSKLLEQRWSDRNGNWSNHRGLTPLDCALSQDWGETARILMQREGLVAALVSKEQHPKHPATLLHVMVRLGRASVVAMLLGRPEYAKEVNTTNPDGLAPLHVSAARGFVKIVKQLLDHGADPHVVESGGWTPLQFAIQYGQTDVTAALLQASPCSRTHSMHSSTANQTLPPMHHAVASGDMATIRLLLRRKLSVDMLSASGQTALHHASMLGLQDVVLLLLQRGADPVACDLEQMTPLLLAAEGGHVQVMQQLFAWEQDTQRHLSVLARWKLPISYQEVLLPFLLNRTSNNLNTLTTGGTVLHQAAQCGHAAIAKLLVENGAHISIKDQEGRVAADVAGISDQFELVYILESEPFGRVERLIHDSVRQRDVSRVYAVIAAAPKGLRRRVKAMALAAAALTKEEPLIITLKRSISIDEDQGWGWRPLYVATLRGDRKAMQLLLKHGVSPNLKTNSGITPLLQAAEGGHPQLIQLLLRYGANVEERDPQGHTALQVAATYLQARAVTTLLEGGADPHSCDAHGKTALDLALDQGGEKLLKGVGVKTVTFGGRPQTGPMQAIRGSEECQVASLETLTPFAKGLLMAVDQAAKAGTSVLSTEETNKLMQIFPQPA